jgi:hypothetical protein
VRLLKIKIPSKNMLEKPTNTPIIHGVVREPRHYTQHAHP